MPAPPLLFVFGRRSAGFIFENLIKVIYIRKTAHFGNLRNTEIICAYEIFCIVNFQTNKVSVWGQSETVFEKIIESSACECIVFLASISISFIAATISPAEPVAKSHT